MKKFNNTLVTSVKKENEEKKQQMALRKKYNSTENVRIVEKNGFGKFLISLLVNFIKTCFSIVLCSLSLIGLLSLIYPETRELIILFFRSGIEQVIAYF